MPKKSNVVEMAPQVYKVDTSDLSQEEIDFFNRVNEYVQTLRDDPGPTNEYDAEEYLRKVATVSIKWGEEEKPDEITVKATWDDGFARADALTLKEKCGRVTPRLLLRLAQETHRWRLRKRVGDF